MGCCAGKTAAAADVDEAGALGAGAACEDGRGSMPANAADDVEAAIYRALRDVPFGTPAPVLADIMSATFVFRVVPPASAAPSGAQCEPDAAALAAAPSPASNAIPVAAARKPLAELCTPPGKQMRSEYIVAALRDRDEAAAHAVECQGMYVDVYVPRKERC